MSLTVSYVSSIDSEKWRLVSDKKKCVKYKREMSSWERTYILVQLALKVFSSLGRYLPLWNKESKSDWKNWKQRKWICYVSKTSIPRPDQKIEFNKSIDEILSNPIPERPQESKTVTQVYRDLLKKSEEYRSLKKKIYSVRHREVFLEKLYEKDQKIALAIERALNNLDSENSGLFIRLLSPVYEDSKFNQIFQKAVEATKRLQKEHKTEGQKKFEALYDKYNDHPAKAEWLFSIFQQKDSPLADFVLKLMDLRGVYSPLFQTWIEDSNLYQLCMDSLAQEQLESSASFEKMKETYQDFYQIQKKLNENVDSKGVHYTYKQFLKDRLLVEEYDPVLQLSLEINQIGSSFIWQYVSRKDLPKVLQKIQGYLSDTTFHEAAKSEYGHKMAAAQAALKDAEDNLRASLTQKAFECLMQHNDNSNFRDAISKMIDVEELFNLDGNYRKLKDSNFFAFLRALKSSEFFRQRSQAKCDLKFYQELNSYFKEIPGYIADFHKILHAS